MSEAPFTRGQRTIIVYGIMSVIVVMVIVQLWLLTATMNAFLGGDVGIILPAALASLVCLLFNLGLLRYLHGNSRTNK
ncbi:MAG TPA: DUF6755 family protein [Candidatus Kapabacteria bacterium]|nr:DUF6755 family protein [Candidatus Kapabacteria bacterium]